MTYRKVLVLLVLLFHFAASGWAQVPGFFMKDDVRKVKMPFYSANSLIIMPVSINGSEPINFLVDTGVRSNILFSKALGDALGLKYTRRLSIAGADGSTVIMAQVSPVNSLDFGEVEGNLQSLLVLEENFLELESVIGVPVYGIIGYEFFKFNPVKINYDSGILEFYRGSAMKWKPLFYRKFDMAIEDSKAYVTAKVTQKDGSKLEAKLLIDTGANHGLLLNPETTDEITMPPVFIESQLGQSLGGILYGFIGRVNSLNIHGLVMKDVLTSYPDKTSFSNLILATGRQGSLGAEVLGRTTLVLDYPRNRAMLRKGENFYAPFEFDMSGLIIKKVPNDDNRFFISEVREGSPAYKTGVLAFDEILSINRVPTFLWELSEIFKLLRSEEGREIELEMRRYIDNDLAKFSDYKVSIFLKKQI
ncbi:pepsin/retropepsin-like aspartic protease family protein [Algoriphagus terrigena]|uniref:pepsin/retropepsin-like aspartic protease family protein n=1 Tax=Algoriphagus terrigena TaxID=344884 RepID=UPI0004018677|nr:aspartyl protease family protein [Algoriphagus terrigena]